MLIFLDIDGVMVSGASWKAPEKLEDGFYSFNKSAVDALNNLMSADSKVVLTTSHRDQFSIGEWKDIFARRGILIDHLDRLPPKQDVIASRKDEIVNWFSYNTNVKDFWIIDDDTSLNALPNDLKERLILTSSTVGLTPRLLEEAMHVS